MNISNLPQQPEENMNNNLSLPKESIVLDVEIAERLLLEENSLSSVQLAVDIGKPEDYDFASEEGNVRASTVEQLEDWCWVEMTDELDWEDEEERSELAEIDEYRIFYASKMRL